MSAQPTRSLLEEQVDLTRKVLQYRLGIEVHLLSNVSPHLEPSASDAIHDLIDALSDEEYGISPNLALFLEIVMAEIKAAIAAGTREEAVPIPPELLIGCSEAYDTRTVLSPEAEALRDALPPLERLYHAAREALGFAEAIRASLRMLNPDID